MSYTSSNQPAAPSAGGVPRYASGPLLFFVPGGPCAPPASARLSGLWQLLSSPPAVLASLSSRAVPVHCVPLSSHKRSISRRMARGPAQSPPHQAEPRRWREGFELLRVSVPQTAGSHARRRAVTVGVCYVARALALTVLLDLRERSAVPPPGSFRYGQSGAACGG